MLKTIENAVRRMVLRVLVRVLGPEDYGVFALAISVASLVFLPADFGISQSTARFVAEPRREDPRDGHRQVRAVLQAPVSGLGDIGGQCEALDERGGRCDLPHEVTRARGGCEREVLATEGNPTGAHREIAYRERIATRDWMSAETKKQANKKLDLLIRKVGYPEKWKDYTGLEVSTDNYWANICRVNTWLVKDNLADLKKPVDRMKWQMTPVTVNAYYDPTTNEITFPAAILQPPFFDPEADDAANYGTMGAIIGHELTHGFDDQGARFDAQGNMNMWWTKEDYARFKEKTQMIVRQFDGYVALDSLHVNGQLTQGENIADLGGLTMAYYAYKNSLGGKPSPVISKLTGEQRFFVGFSRIWQQVIRPEEAARRLAIDPHSPSEFRANVVRHVAAPRRGW